MYKDKISPQDVCDLLNELLAKDPESVNELISLRVPCNQEIADHPTVQVMCHPDINKPSVGMLGILNGLFGLNDEDGFGAIVFMTNSDSETCKFELSEQYRSRCVACKDTGIVNHGVSGLSRCSCKKGQEEE